MIIWVWIINTKLEYGVLKPFYVYVSQKSSILYVFYSSFHNYGTYYILRYYYILEYIYKFSHGVCACVHIIVFHREYVVYLFHVDIVFLVCSILYELSSKKIVCSILILNLVLGTTKSMEYVFLRTWSIYAFLWRVEYMCLVVWRNILLILEWCM